MIEQYLPPQSRQFYMRVKAQKHEEAIADHRERLGVLRAESAARGSLLNGQQLLTEWQLSERLVDVMSAGLLEAALEVCDLYEIPLDQNLSNCIEAEIKGFIETQFRHALRNHSTAIGGSILPTSIKDVFAGRIPAATFNILNPIQIRLEKARVQGTRVAPQKEFSMNQIFNVHGPNARVNIDSTDNSTNTINQGIHFSELRKAIESGVADGVERATILERLADLEAATDSKSGSERYQAFIASAHHHMALIGPFLPALGHWVHALLVAAT
jgi:hypothetical protein